MLVGDPGAPAVLFVLGDPTVLEGKPRVAIVGTRSATHYGRQVASELARDLAAEGVVVVSGLARGIDGAAHAGGIAGQGVATRRRLSPSSAPDWMSYTHHRIATCGPRWRPEGRFSPSPPWGQNRIRGCFRLAIGSSLRSRTWWWWSKAIAAEVPSTRLRRRPDARFRSARFRVLFGAVPRTGPTLSWSTGAPRFATWPMYLWLSRWPGRVSSRVAPMPDWSDKAVHQVDRSPTASTGGEQTGPKQIPPRHDSVQRAVLAAVDDVPTRFETILIRTGLSIASAAEACDQLTEQGSLLAGAGWWSLRQDDRKTGRS